LTGLILLGFLLVSLPLLAGVVSAALQMTRLSDASQQLVNYGVDATRYSQLLVRQIAAMERSARLFQLLGRPELLQGFQENHRRMGDVLSALEGLPGDAARSEVAGRLQRTAAEIAAGVESGERREMAHALGRFGELSRTGGQLATLASQQIGQELQQVRETTEQARRRLFWQAAALVPISLALAFLFTLFLARPIRDLDRSIRELGHGQLDQPVRVRGPVDLEALGGQIEWLRVRLLEISEERERFLRHMSHELKTPLSSIREGTELMLDGAVGPLSADQREVATILRENSLRLQRLIENLLSFAAWQAQVRGLSLSTFRLEPLVRMVAESHQLSVAANGLQMDMQIEDLTIEADHAKMSLILDNLLSNAIKLSPAGGRVRIRARQQDAENWLLEVADEGPGVPEAERERIFEAFYQTPMPQAGRVRGTGIGLSVVKEFVLAHGGSVTCGSGDLAGAHFRVTLPLHAETRDIQPASAAPASPSEIITHATIQP
jgi:two-component system sensor histidine kinase GlrK